MSTNLIFSAVPITFPVIERLRARYPGTFSGIKDSAGDLSHMEALVERFPGLAVLAGADPLMLPLLRKGGAGCITATSSGSSQRPFGKPLPRASRSYRRMPAPMVQRERPSP